MFSLPDGTKVDTDETGTAGMVVDEVRETDGVPVGHIVNKKAVEAGMEGSRVGVPNKIDDHVSTMIVDHAQSRKLLTNQSARIRHKMNLLFESMQSLGTGMELRVGLLENRVQEGFAKDGRLRKQDYENLEKKNDEHGGWFQERRECQTADSKGVGRRER